MSEITAESKLGLATDFLMNRKLFLAAAAKLRALSESEFIDHLKQSKFDIVLADAQTAKETDILNTWLF